VATPTARHLEDAGHVLDLTTQRAFVGLAGEEPARAGLVSQP
jgi:hypothetical protein